MEHSHLANGDNSWQGQGQGIVAGQRRPRWRGRRDKSLGGQGGSEERGSRDSCDKGRKTRRGWTRGKELHRARGTDHQAGFFLAWVGLRYLAPKVVFKQYLDKGSRFKVIFKVV